MTQPTQDSTTGRELESPLTPGAPQLDLIECDGCGRRFATADGPAMLVAITGPCPTCGGSFELRGSSES
jgi:hypothetical protein